MHAMGCSMLAIKKPFLSLSSLILKVLSDMPQVTSMIQLPVVEMREKMRKSALSLHHYTYTLHCIHYTAYTFVQFTILHCIHCTAYSFIQYTILHCIH
jgi:hypothetical protein